MRDNKGQSLVEMAFVLVPFFVCVFALIRILAFGLNQLVLQRMAQIAANQVTTTTPGGTKNYSMYHGNFWGPVEELHWVSDRQTALRWIPYRGYATTGSNFLSGSSARLMKIDLQVQSQSNSSFTQALARIANHSSSIALIAPPTPDRRP